jgi:hypothetical protein
MRQMLPLLLEGRLAQMPLIAAHLAPEAEFPYTLGLVVVPDHDLHTQTPSHSMYSKTFLPSLPFRDRCMKGVGLAPAPHVGCCCLLLQR